MKTIVISAVNIRKGGTLTILRECLNYLSTSGMAERYRTVAIVHDKNLALFPGIEYIEIPDTVKSWSRRLWCEYVSMYYISKKLQPVYLWLSLHDTTPNVLAERQAVYCQTSFPFMKRKWRDLFFNYKVMLFSLFTRFAYRINIKNNNWLIVQADWLRSSMSQMFNLDRHKFIVAPPEIKLAGKTETHLHKNQCYTFLFPATPDCHKNFEIICQAVHLLEKEIKPGTFKVIFTIDGSENKYSRWLYRKWGKLASIHFAGYMSQDRLFRTYAESDCLLFPSRIETWGLPISEFATFSKPMLLADLPYAHETSAGYKNVAFFKTSDIKQLKEEMKKLVMNDISFLSSTNRPAIEQPVATTWQELFSILTD